MKTKSKRYRLHASLSWLALLSTALLFGVRGHSSDSPGNFIAIHMPPKAFEAIAQEFSGISFPMKFDRIDFQEMLEKIEENKKAMAKFAGLDCSGIALNDVRGRISVDRVEVNPPDGGALVAHFTLNELVVQAELEEPDNIREMSKFCRGTAGIFADPSGLRANRTTFSVQANIKDGSLLLETPELVGNVQIGEFVLPENWTSRLNDQERETPDSVKSLLMFWYPMLINMLMSDVVAEKVDIKRLFPIPVPLGAGYQALIQNSPRLERGYIGEVNEDSSVTFMFEGEITPTKQRQARQLGNCPKPERPPYSPFKFRSPRINDGAFSGALPTFSNEPGASPFQVAITTSMINHALAQFYEDRWACFEQSSSLQGILHALRPTTMPQDTHLGLNAHFMAPPVVSFAGRDGSGFNANLSARIGLQFFLDMEHRKIPMSSAQLDQLELEAGITLDERGVNVGLEASDDNANRMKLSLPSSALFSGQNLDIEIDALNRLVSSQIVPGLMDMDFNVIGKHTELRGGTILTTQSASFENDFLLVGFAIEGLRKALGASADRTATLYGVAGIKNQLEEDDDAN